MCTQQERQTLYNYLNRGTFPGTSGMEIGLCNCLLQLLEANANTTVAAINPNLFTNIMTVNGVTLNTGMASVPAFRGYAHTWLCRDFQTASRDPLQTLIHRLRTVASANHGLTQSNVRLALDAGTQMGNGLVVNPLTYIPNPVLGVALRSTPDQEVMPVGARTVQAEIVRYEPYLPASFVISCDAMNDAGNWVNIVNKVPILTYVPETVPHLRRERD